MTIFRFKVSICLTISEIVAVQMAIRKLKIGSGGPCQQRGGSEFHQDYIMEAQRLLRINSLLSLEMRHKTLFNFPSTAGV